MPTVETLASDSSQFWIRKISGFLDGHQYDCTVTYTLGGTPYPIPGSGAKITARIPPAEKRSRSGPGYQTTLNPPSVVSSNFLASGSSNYLAPLYVSSGTVDDAAGDTFDGIPQNGDPTNWAMEFDGIPDGIYTVNVTYDSTDGSIDSFSEPAGDVTVTTAPPECDC
jgi:hypothetical protein